MADAASLRDLLTRARRREPAACAQLIAEWGPAIRREIRVRLSATQMRHRCDSEDLCQSVLRAFFLHLEVGSWDIREPRQVLALVIRLARNRTLNELERQRAARRDVRKTRSIQEIELSREEATAGPDPAETIALREWLDRCRSLLSAEEQAIVDRRLDGETWEQISQALGATPEAIRKRLSRGVDRVLNEVDGQGSSLEEPLEKS